MSKYRDIEDIPYRRGGAVSGEAATLLALRTDIWYPERIDKPDDALNLKAPIERQTCHLHS